MSIKIKILRGLKRTGLSQNNLSKVSGVSQSTINQYVQGNRDITTSRADLLIKALNKTLKQQGRKPV